MKSEDKVHLILVDLDFSRLQFLSAPTQTTDNSYKNKYPCQNNPARIDWIKVQRVLRFIVSVNNNVNADIAIYPHFNSSCF